MKKVALIIDIPGWAFDNIAKNIKPNLSEYEVDIIPFVYFNGNIVRLLIYCKDYDIIHFFWRGNFLLLDKDENKKYAESLGFEYDEFIKEYVLNKNISFSVCDELFIRGPEEWKTKEIMKYSHKYSVTSKKLWDEYNKYDVKPSMIIHDGVDLKKYKPKNLDRLVSDKTLVVGWAGNSKFTDEEHDSDVKGVENILKPAIKELQEEGYNVELKLADRNIKKIEQEDMPEFYNSIDVYVCASKAEGTPLTVIESMAMGLPVISTDVGIVKEAFGEKQTHYIFERNKDALKEKIIELLNNRQEMKNLSYENLERVKDWDWPNIAKRYSELWEK